MSYMLDQEDKGKMLFALVAPHPDCKYLVFPLKNKMDWEMLMSELQERALEEPYTIRIRFEHHKPEWFNSFPEV